MRIGRVGKEARSTEISTGGELWHGFERDQAKFPSWYSGVKNTEATLFGQGLSPQALNKCYSVCWQWTLAGTGDVKMDTDKNNQGKSGRKKQFLSVQTCCCLWLLSKATQNSDHGPFRGIYFMKKGERNGNIMGSCLWSSCQRGWAAQEEHMWVGPAQNELEDFVMHPGNNCSKTQTTGTVNK